VFPYYGACIGTSEGQFVHDAILYWLIYRRRGGSVGPSDERAAAQSEYYTINSLEGVDAGSRMCYLSTF